MTQPMKEVPLPRLQLGKELYRDYVLKISLHIRLRLEARQLTIDEVVEHLTQPATDPIIVKTGPDKYDAYYKVSNNNYNRYVLQRNGYEKTITLVTAVKIKKKWQKAVEKHERKRV